MKHIAIDLITNDLVNTKLILGLHALNIDAGIYSMYLAESIFTVMGIAPEQQNTALYDLYAQLCSRGAEAVVVADDRLAVRALAEGIYERLEVWVGARPPRF